MPLRQQNMQTIDGNTAAAHVGYAFSDTATIYPITPSTPMCEIADAWSARGRKNLFGQQLKVVQMQSESGAAGALHGSLAAGGFSTTFTASQGLLLMIPDMYKISGELLPTVIHASARAVAGHALSIFGDHSDVMAARQTGFAMLASSSVQEVMDLAIVAHLASLKSNVPFLHFFEGFRLSHEIAKIDVVEYDEIAKLVPWDKVEVFKKRGMNPEHPHLRGTAQNPDVFFQNKEAANKYYLATPGIVEETMGVISQLTGRPYGLFDYVGAQDAENVIVMMGSGAQVAEEAVNFLVSQGQKVGLVKVRLYRPWSKEHFLRALPKSVKRISVLDRTKEPGALGEPLYLDVSTTLKEEDMSALVVGGRYGLGSKDFTPAMVEGVFDNLADAKPKRMFTVGINDDVTNLSLPIPKDVDMTPEGTIQCKFWGLGADGTVGANNNAIKIVGDNTDLYAQAYFAYDAKKSGGTTVSHLRFGKEKIRSSYLINTADYIACHNQSFVDKFDLLRGIKDGGTFVLNCQWSQEELEEKLPASLRSTIAKKNLKFYTINAVKLAVEVGLGARINMIMQTVFFKLSGVLPVEEAIARLKDAIKKAYGKKGDKIVNMNNAGVDASLDNLVEIEVPKSWAGAVSAGDENHTEPKWVQEVMLPMALQEGDHLPVSAFGAELDGEYSYTGPDGSFPVATTKYEKRAIAVNVPKWAPENCTQCNQCSYVCPHATIRPFLMDDDQVAKAPEGFVAVQAIGKTLKQYKYSLQVSSLDCVGCGACAETCPGKKGEKALTMVPLVSQAETQPHFNYAVDLPTQTGGADIETVKGSQFLKPLFEFSGACPGCGETPYVKLATQLYGDRMLIANATGCSSIYGGSPPAVPFCVNEKGHGPTWGNSLFEENAEFGFGMRLALDARRDRLGRLMKEAIATDISSDLKEAMSGWLANRELAEPSREAGDRIAALLKKEAGSNQLLSDINSMADLFTKKSVWIVGGDGWAYDIGFGGLDHVVAQNQDVNILVMDTEVYSNTGGQQSKATPTGSVAKFAASGKKIMKKDLGRMLMSYGYVYVASIAMGASRKQTLKAFLEAERYPGPSVIMAYSPCINQGLKIGMHRCQEEEKIAVEIGYWLLYRYNPMLRAEGKNPLIFESKEPKGDFQGFLKSEVRYASLLSAFPQEAERLHAQLEKEYMERYKEYKQLAELEPVK